MRRAEERNIHTLWGTAGYTNGIIGMSIQRTSDISLIFPHVADEGEVICGLSDTVSPADTPTATQAYGMGVSLSYDAGLYSPQYLTHARANTGTLDIDAGVALRNTKLRLLYPWPGLYENHRQTL